MKRKVNENDGQVGGTGSEGGDAREDKDVK